MDGREDMASWYRVRRESGKRLPTDFNAQLTIRTFGSVRSLHSRLQRVSTKHPIRIRRHESIAIGSKNTRPFRLIASWKRNRFPASGRPVESQEIILSIGEPASDYLVRVTDRDPATQIDSSFRKVVTGNLGAIK